MYKKIKYEIYIHPSKSIAIHNVKLLLVLITLTKWIIKKIHKWDQDGGFLIKKLETESWEKFKSKVSFFGKKNENQGTFNKEQGTFNSTGSLLQAERKYWCVPVISALLFIQGKLRPSSHVFPSLSHNYHTYNLLRPTGWGFPIKQSAVTPAVCLQFNSILTLSSQR